MQITMLPLMVCLSLLLSLPSQSFAQQSASASCDVPLVVTRFNVSTRTVELVRDLGLNDFEVQLDGAPAILQNLSIDDGPKRIALILDASRNVPDDEWNLEAEMAASLVEYARPADRFVLQYLGVDGGIASLLSPREADERLRKVTFSRPVPTDPGERVYDAVLEAANRLDPPRFGDVVFLFGHPEDSGSKTTPDQLQELVLKSNLRFYGVSFSDPLEGKLAGVDLNKPLPANLRSLVSPRLAESISATGYFFSFHSVRNLGLPGQTQLFHGFLRDLYAGIAAPYRLSIPAVSKQGLTKLEITVSNLHERNIYPRDVHYPKFVFSCALLPPLTQ